MMKLYSGPLSMFGAKAQIAIREKGAACEVAMVSFALGRGYRPKDPEVLRVNPKGQVPVLLDGDVEVFDSTQIFEYLEDRFPTPALWPADAASRVLARQLEHASDEIFFPHVIALMGGRAALDSDEARGARVGARAYYGRMDAQLAGREYLAGPFTYTDIAFYMAQLFGAFLTAPMPAGTPALQAWRARMTARPAVAAVAAPMGAYLAANGLACPDFLIPLLPSASLD